MIFGDRGRRRLRGVIACAGFFAAVQAAAEFDLGRIDEYKLESYSDYFEQFWNGDALVFRDDEQREKISAEALGVCEWMRDSASWPEERLVTARMHLNAARLFTIFAAMDQPGAAGESADHLRAAIRKDPSDHQGYIRLARQFYRQGGAAAKESALLAEKALKLNEVESSGQDAYYIAAVGLYHSGYFKRARYWLLRQEALDPDVQNTRNLSFVFDMLVRQWGYEPDRVRFVADAEGNPSPVPVES